MAEDSEFFFFRRKASHRQDKIPLNTINLRAIYVNVSILQGIIIFMNVSIGFEFGSDRKIIAPFK